MKYLLMLYQDSAFEAEWDAMTDEAKGAVLEQFAAFDEAAKATGATILGGNELGLSHTATTLRAAGDEFTVTDGPFAEVTEHLGGYYEIEARDLDHAIEVAKLLPSEKTEIRPIVEYEG
jgi:hypothetical protein